MSGRTAGLAEGWLGSGNVTAWATVLLAIGALAALILNARTLRAAFAGVQESQRARIDARAPRVVIVEAPEPTWPAARRQSHVTGSRWALSSADTFDLPGAANKQLFLTAYVLLHNEGASSAFVHLPVGGIPVWDKQVRPDDAGIETFDWSGQVRLSCRIGPGESQWVLIENGHTVQRWAELWRMFNGAIVGVEPAPGSAAAVPGVRFVFEVTDQFTDSFHDELTVDVLGLPITPIEGSTDRWQARTFVNGPLASTTATRIIGLRRTYGH
ncbi:MAG: hypothetical protein ABIP57_13955 [Jatrophihabitantaceae bacterium]